MRKCTTPGCSGRLIQKNCKGHGGYPVTHFWRFANGAVYFQSKGRHDHVKPMAKTMGHGTLLGAAATNNSSAASSSASSSSLQSPRNSAAAAKMRQQQQLKLRLQMVREEREADRSGRLCIGHEYGTALKSNDVLVSGSTRNRINFKPTSSSTIVIISTTRNNNRNSNSEISFASASSFQNASGHSVHSSHTSTASSHLSPNATPRHYQLNAPPRQPPLLGVVLFICFLLHHRIKSILLA